MMASFSFSTATATAKSNSHRLLKAHEKQTHPFTTSCNATPTPDGDRKLRTSIGIQNVDRRNFILGICSLIGTASNLTSLRPALAQTAHGNESKISDMSVGEVKKAEDVELPVKLDQIVKVLVKRPAVNRTKEDKEKANEILSVTGVKVNSEKFVKFDVIVNAEDETAITPADSEFAGSFALLPYRHTLSGSTTTMSGARFGLTELLEDIEAENDEYVLVSLVPRTGCEDATVSEIKIELVPVV